MSDLNGPAALVVDSTGKPRGSAFRVSDSIFLTADHVIADPDARYRIRILGSEKFSDCETIWRGGTRYSAALLKSDLSSGGSPRFPEEIRFGELSGRGVRKCDITGFTRSWDSFSNESIAARITGTIDPGEYPGSPNLIFEPSRRPIETQGLGGAGVCFSDGLLVGVIVAYHEENSFFLVAPISTLLEDSGFRNTLSGALNRDVSVTPIHPVEEGVDDALKEISKADPANILEVAAAQFKLSDRYYENVLSQARRSFNSAVVAAITGTLFFLAAITFALVSKQATAALISSIGGGVVEVVSGLNFWLYGRTSIQLNSFHMRLERMQRYLVANSVAASLPANDRSTALINLVSAIAKSDQLGAPEGSEPQKVTGKTKTKLAPD